MKGNVIKTFERTSQATGKKYWNVMVQNEGTTSVESYLTSADSLSKEGSTIEFNVDPPKKAGDIPWIRPIGQQSYSKGGDKKGNVKAFACSYAKDIVVAMIGTMSPEQLVLLDKDAVEKDLERYYKWFIKKMEE